VADGLGGRLGGVARAHRGAIVYSTFGAAVFVASLAATFPYAATLTALLRPLRIGFSSSGQGISLPLGAALSDVRLVSLEPASPFEIESPGVTLAPALGALLLGEPGVRVHAELYGGALRATVYRRGAAIGVSFKLSDMGLAQVVAMRGLGGNVIGRISGGVEGSLKLAPGGALRVNRVSGRGPDGEIEGHGTIRLALDAAQSQINLAVTITPSAEGRTRLGVLFGLLPHPPDARSYLLSGPLSAPSIS